MKYNKKYSETRLQRTRLLTNSFWSHIGHCSTQINRVITNKLFVINEFDCIYKMLTLPSFFVCCGSKIRPNEWHSCQNVFRTFTRISLIRIDDQSLISSFRLCTLRSTEMVDKHSTYFLFFVERQFSAPTKRGNWMSKHETEKLITSRW